MTTKAADNVATTPSPKPKKKREKKVKNKEDANGASPAKKTKKAKVDSPKEKKPKVKKTKKEGDPSTPKKKKVPKKKAKSPSTKAEPSTSSQANANQPSSSTTTTNPDQDKGKSQESNKTTAQTESAAKGVAGLMSLKAQEQNKQKEEEKKKQEQEDNEKWKDWNAGPPEIEPDEIEYFEKIGGGCFGEVFRGRCRGIDVAVKKLSRQDLDEKTLQDFKKEVEIMSKLNHPNIVLFLGACTKPGHMAIVTEIIQKGNFQQMLHNPKFNLSLHRRMLMTRDAALGMNWLHESRPAIIHRDIKPSNFLIDNNLIVKVCDFGLSAIKPRGEQLRDKDSIPGTPLWMAPEVLQGKPIDEKSDVYSFGLVIWEIVTQQELFPHHNDYVGFKRAICGPKKERPEIPRDTLPSLVALMQKCWDPLPENRPSFKNIISMLDHVIIDVSIRKDEDGRNYWKEYGLARSDLSWRDFWISFKKYSINTLQVCKELGDKEWEDASKCMKAMLTERDKNANERKKAGAGEDDLLVVTIERFGKMLEFFGPMKRMVDKVMGAMVGCEWFFGELGKDDADSRLRDQGSGVFLVRLSATEAGCFTISRVNKKGIVCHQRVQYRPEESKFEVMKAGGGVGKTYQVEHLKSFVSAVKTEWNLEKACPGWPFKNLLVKGPVLDGYLLADEDDEDNTSDDGSD